MKTALRRSRNERTPSAASSLRITGTRSRDICVTAAARSAWTEPRTLLIGLVTGPANLTARWWRDPLSLAFALLLVGGPLWAYQWFRAEAEARSGDPDERRALPRRLPAICCCASPRPA